MSTHRHQRARRGRDSARRARLLTLLGLALILPLLSAERVSGQESDREIELLLSAEREEADRARRRGEVRRAQRAFSELLEEEPADAESRLGLARCLVDQDQREEALAEARRALGDARGLEGAARGRLRAACARVVAAVCLSRGEADRAARELLALEGDLRPGHDARDALALGRALIATGDREGGRELFRKGANTPMVDSWEQLLAKGSCEHELGWLERASRSLVAADSAAIASGSPEPDVLVALASVYFEADREVAHAEARARSPQELLREALELHPAHEGALLALFLLHRHNWQLQRRSAHEVLAELLSARPDSIEALLMAASSDLDDGRLRSARQRAARLRQLAPARRELRTLEAALAWIEHRREDAEALLQELAEADPADGAPEREVGQHLCELYRFAEGLPFLRRSVERDPSDHRAWTQLGRALANTGDEVAARQALDRAREEAHGRQDPWRKNTRLVLDRMAESFAEDEDGEHTFAWLPDARELMSLYWVPLYADAREELARRYGYTPGPVRIEVFRRHADFSVRSTGYEGFPALGVCFGPVVTAVSPLSEMRGTFSWARTSFHEFTHVVHLGLSHNRCPRWITEGLATWEEVNANPTWTRNLRRDLLAAYHNGALIPVRELNRAFRGPRILFGYYQGGLLCEMLIAEHGFPSMVRLLEAFDRGLDLDRALADVFGRTPEEIDAEFQAFTATLLAPLQLEPHWSPRTVAQLRLRLPADPPADEERREAWERDWGTVAWGSFQGGREVDAQQALRRLAAAGLGGARADFLRGEMALVAGDRVQARKSWQEALAAGGEDYRARMALGEMARQDGRLELAIEHFQAAEACFPGYPDRSFSAELSLARALEEEDRMEECMRALERWLAYNPGEFDERVEVARWNAEAGRLEEAERWYGEANQVDPFRCRLHSEWAEVLVRAGRWEEAARELRAARLVPVELDPDGPPLTAAERASHMAREAAALRELGRSEEAAEILRRALELDPDCEEALELGGAGG